MPKVFKICISPKPDQRMEDIHTVTTIAGKGIVGDRYFSKDNDKNHQLTLIESENIDFYNKKFSTNFSYLDFRRNLITKNIQLNDLVGKKLSIGQIDIEVHDLCRPCKYLQESLGKDNIVKEFLRRGGLRCEILVSGNIQVGDEIRVL